MSAEPQIEPVPTRDIVVVGASAGGVEALSQLVAALPGNLSACIVVVLHVPASGPSALPQILSRSGPLKAFHVTHGDPVEPGRIYIAPPNRHVVFAGGRLLLSSGARENGHRPAVDPLFRSAAREYGSRVVAVVLSGALDDGSAGVAVVKAAGGLTAVQDPAEATYPAMPLNAMAAARIDRVGSTKEIAGFIVERAGEPIERPRSSLDGEAGAVTDTEVALSMVDPEVIHDDNANPGEASTYSCPDCHGVLNAIDEGTFVRFRCRTGHAWSPDALAAAQTSAVENALWIALRSLEEKASLAHRMAASATARGATTTARRFDEQAAETRHNAELVRQLVVRWGATPTGGDAMAEV